MQKPNMILVHNSLTVVTCLMSCSGDLIDVISLMLNESGLHADCRSSGHDPFQANQVSFARVIGLTLLICAAGVHGGSPPCSDLTQHRTCRVSLTLSPEQVRFHLFKQFELCMTWT